MVVPVKLEVHLELTGLLLESFYLPCRQKVLPECSKKSTLSLTLQALKKPREKQSKLLINGPPLVPTQTTNITISVRTNKKKLVVKASYIPLRDGFTYRHRYRHPIRLAVGEELLLDRPTDRRNY